MDPTHKQENDVLSLADRIPVWQAQEIDPRTIDFSKVNTPDVKTKVQLFDYLRGTGLPEDSPLFMRAFAHFGKNLKLR
ncbi:MAG: hypothetical protein WKF87_17865 [Chryseolinea sp.]